MNFKSYVEKPLEILANIAIVVACVLLAVTLYSNKKTQRSGNFPALNRAAQTNLSVGKKLTLTGVDWAASDSNLVLALSTSCHFCNDSAPFYQQLTSLHSKSGQQPQLIAVFPQRQEDAVKYLAAKQIRVTKVVGLPALQDIDVDGTPTLIEVDRNGIVKKFWIGRLQKDQEGEVETELFGPPKTSS